MFGNNNGNKQERPQADAFVNNLSIVPKGANADQAISLGLSKSVLPLIGEDNAVHAKLVEAAKAAQENGDDVITIQLTAQVRLNSKVHGEQVELPADVQFAI